MRKTFRVRHGGIDQPLVGIGVYGVSWREAFQACLGFLADEDVPPGHFAAADLELLAKTARERLHRVNEDARLHRADAQRERHSTSDPP